LKEAEAVLRQAAMAAPNDPVIRANRDIVDVLIGRFSADKPGGISRAEWARRLNNAGYVASTSGDRATAIGLLTRSILTSDIYYARAANNLAKAQGAQ
jgi:Flp pilus assembly protein TadD